MNARRSLDSEHYQSPDRSLSKKRILSVVSRRKSFLGNWLKTKTDECRGCDKFQKYK